MYTQFKKKFSNILIFSFAVALFICSIDFIRFPDKYLTTWKYQLHNEIKNGDTEAIEYYKKYYTSKGVYLYGEDAEPENDLINLATVTDFEATEHGVLLHTEDGNGYFIER